MQRLSMKEGLLALGLMTGPVAGYSFEAVVKLGVQSTRDEIAAIAQGVELNSLIWGNPLAEDPTNYWAQKIDEQGK